MLAKQQTVEGECHITTVLFDNNYELLHDRIDIKIATASQVPWDLDDGFDDLLPVMQSDIMLIYKDKVLIIDAKYYAHMTQSQYGVSTLHSNNLYQIFTYVKNMSTSLKDVSHEVAGMLMYAKTDEDFQLPEKVYRMSGNQITVGILNLNCDFVDIAAQLNKVVERHFGLTNQGIV